MLGKILARRRLFDEALHLVRHAQRLGHAPAVRADFDAVQLLTNATEHLLRALDVRAALPAAARHRAVARRLVGVPHRAGEVGLRPARTAGAAAAKQRLAAVLLLLLLCLLAAFGVGRVRRRRRKRTRQEAMFPSGSRRRRSSGRAGRKRLAPW